MTTATHTTHDTWPLISDPGSVWCRDCQTHYRPADDAKAALNAWRARIDNVIAATGCTVTEADRFIRNADRIQSMIEERTAR